MGPTRRSCPNTVTLAGAAEASAPDPQGRPQEDTGTGGGAQPEVDGAASRGSCDPNPCVHGRCVASDQGTTCDCTGTGFDGARCERDVDECASAGVVCTSADHPCVDTAPPGYTCQGEFAEWPMPDSVSDGAKVGPAYSGGPDEPVRDEVTGLVWQRVLPQVYPGCSGRVSNQGSVGEACTWSEARAYCASLGGGFRLPGKLELVSLVDVTRSNPAIDTDVFPGTMGHGFWTASPYVYGGAQNYAWVVRFSDGSVVGDANASTHRVRCVR